MTPTFVAKLRCLWPGPTLRRQLRQSEARNRHLAATLTRYTVERHTAVLAAAELRRELNWWRYCPEHGPNCGADDCCCADRHRPEHREAVAS